MGESQNQKSDLIEAAGGILWRYTSSGKEIAIIHRTRYGDWTFPKGKREPGESWTDTAKREVYEETSCLTQLGDFIGCQLYTVNGFPKIVLYWQMYLIDDKGFSPSKEVDKLLWLPRHKARVLMTYPAEKEFIDHVRE
jgi:8-oxo-dGTP diphosphatase